MLFVSTECGSSWHFEDLHGSRRKFRHPLLAFGQTLSGKDDDEEHIAFTTKGPTWKFVRRTGILILEALGTIKMSERSWPQTQ